MSLLSALLPCIVFLVSDKKHVFAGNNEDYMDPETRMWVVPGEGGKHGRVCFGFTNGFAQGGINDAGLFFDGLALEHEAVATSEKPPIAGNLGDRALAECGSVREVVELFERHDRSFLAEAQLLFGDRSGDAVIIEGNAILRKKGSYLLATNYRQSSTPAKSATCERFRSASGLLDGTGEVTLDLCRKVLSATRQEGPVSTLYSNVYDLREGKIHLYHFHDFETVVVIDVAEALAKGAHTVEIASLFPETFAFASFVRQAAEELEARREKERDRTVDPKTFDAFEGRYRVQSGEAAGFEFRVRREKDRLLAHFPEQEPVELIPRGGANFVCISSTERAELTFGHDANGAVDRAALSQGELHFEAIRIE